MKQEGIPFVPSRRGRLTRRIEGLVGLAGRTAPANDGGTTLGRGLYAVSMVVIVVGFVATRTALLVTSYDTNRNWEETVFLFSASELARDGITHIFDHQDDLNHGGSVVLLLLAVPWIALVGTSLVALKGVAILWSALTLCALMAVAWRYFSATVAVLLGLFYLTLSPTLARINVTLVGSHPEALLPCTLALGCYLESVWRQNECGSETPWVAGVLGLASGLAVWVAYMSAMFVVPLLALRLMRVRSRRAWAALGAGLLLGVLPWIYQNLWLRPHGATMWLQHLGGAGRSRTPAGWLRACGELAESFGYPPPVGGILLGIGVVALAFLCAALSRAPWRSRLPGAPAAVISILMAPVLGVGMLASAVLPLYPNEGYYHYRFFVPLQLSFFWILALAVDVAARWIGRAAAGVAALATLLVGGWGLAPLLMQGNHYQPDYQRDRLAGCTVFGVAEGDRSADAPTGIRRLAAISDEPCRERAFGGFGWTIASRYVEDRNLDATIATLNAIPVTGLRWAACGGFFFLANQTPAEQLAPAQREEALQRLAVYCRAFRP